MNQSELPLVSVIIPAYNSEPFIRQALESVFKQTYPCERTEIIVVDDGSTDETFDVMKEYREKILYVRQENKGIASARNKGITMAKGEIITFLDADDIWHEERLQKVVEKFREKPQAGMVYHPIELIDGKGVIIHKNFYKVFVYGEGLRGWVANEIASGKIFCGGSSFAFRKVVIDWVYPIPEDIRRGVDYYMAALSSCFAETEYIPYILGKYRFHGSNMTMLAGRNNYTELAIVNRDFAFMRQKVIEEIISLDGLDLRTIDLDVIKRIQAKEIIAYNILNGKRFKGIKHLSLLFKGRLDHRDLLKGITVCFMALFVPAFVYPQLIKLYEILKRSKIIKF